MRARELLAPLSVLVLSAPVLFQSAFSGLSAPPNPLPILVACLAVASTAKDLSEALTRFLAPYFAATALAVALSRYPIDQLLGAASGDLATLVIVRNVALYALVTAPFLVAALVVFSYLVERRRALARFAPPAAALAALAAAAWLAASYVDWYNEVYAVRTLSAQLRRVSFAPGNPYPLLSVEIVLRTNSTKALDALYLRYNVLEGTKLVRQVADNFPSGLAISSEGVALGKTIALPESVTRSCFDEGVCKLQLQVVVRTRFGLAPVDFTFTLRA